MERNIVREFKSAVFEYEKTRRQIDDSQEDVSKELLEKEERLREKPLVL